MNKALDDFGELPEDQAAGTVSVPVELWKRVVKDHEVLLPDPWHHWHDREGPGAVLVLTVIMRDSIAKSLREGRRVSEVLPADSEGSETPSR